MGSIIVINSSSSDIFAFVSKYSNSSGSDDWFKIAPGERESWNRGDWELVAFRDSNDTDRTGVYVRANSVVMFKSAKDISVI